MSQQQKILEKLNEGNWICSTDLINLYSVDYRSQINKLRKKGYNIIAKSCNGNCGRKHSGRMNMWFLNPHQTKNPAITEEIAPKLDNMCCYSFRHFGTHIKNCPIFKEIERSAKILEEKTEKNLKLL